jgi:hypothetical protein
MFTTISDAELCAVVASVVCTVCRRYHSYGRLPKIAHPDYTQKISKLREFVEENLLNDEYACTDKRRYSCYATRITASTKDGLIEKIKAAVDYHNERVDLVAACKYKLIVHDV